MFKPCHHATMKRKRPATLAGAIQEVMDREALTLAAAAEMAGISERQLRNLRAGVVSVPRSTTVFGIASLLGLDTVDARELLTAGK